MSRLYLLVFCVLTCLAIASESKLNELSYCKKSISTSLEVTLDCRNLDYKNIPTHISKLAAKRIYLSGNPYYCDCDLVWFVKALEKKSLKIEIADLDRMKCAVPKRMKGKMVKGLTKNDVCPDARPCLRMNCSEYSTCIQDYLTDLDKCVCKPEFKGNGTVCEDLDECSLETHNCAFYEDCYNTVGGFNCRCKPGLKIDSKGQCDVPEPCESLFRPCHSTTEVCENKKRGYQCLCKEGFHKQSGSTTCTDVNECERQDICPKLAQCINKIGSYQCVCKDGYTDSADGKACDDIDECESKKHRCPKHAVCFNRNGGYKCVCKPGYHKENNGTAITCAMKKEDENDTKNILDDKLILYGGVAVAVLVIFIICCCCCCCWCCCCRRKPTKKQKESKEMLFGDQAMKANQDLLNMAMETDPFLLQQQVAIEEQMYMLGMQPQQEYMPYFDDETHKMPKKGVRLNESAITTWSYDEEDDYAEASDDDSDEVYK